MKNELRQFINSFGFLTSEEVEIVVENSNLKAFQKGDLLLKQGQISKECFTVIKGFVREYKIIDGVEKTTAFFMEGEAVNSFSSYTNNTPSDYYIECLEDSVLAVGTESLIEALCELIPRLSTFIMKETGKEAGKFQERLVQFTSSTPEQRFVYLLENNPQLVSRASQIHLASYIGVTPESFSRIKKRVYSK